MSARGMIDDLTIGGDNDPGALVWQANAGDPRALRLLRQVLDRNPILCANTGDLARRAEAALVGLAAGESHIVREAITRELAALKRELAGEAPAPVERLLVDQIAACWLHVYHLDAVLARLLANANHDPVLTARCEEWLSRAQRRYLQALRTLALVRRLLVPTVQINVADQQVNIAQIVPPTGVRASVDQHQPTRPQKPTGRGRRLAARPLKGASAGGTARGARGAAPNGSEDSPSASGRPVHRTAGAPNP